MTSKVLSNRWLWLTGCLAAAFALSTLWLLSDRTVAAGYRDPIDPQASDVERAAAEPPTFLASPLGGDTKHEVTVAEGTPITVALDVALDSRELKNGDLLVASLGEDLVVDGHRVAVAGSPASVRIVDLEHAGRVKGRERMVVSLDQLMTVDGERQVRTSTVTFVADKTVDRDTKVIGAGTLLGAVVGAIADGGEGAAKGAAVGGLGGTAVVLSTKGKDISLPPGYRMTFRLSEAVIAEVSRGPE